MRVKTIEPKSAPQDWLFLDPPEISASDQGTIIM